MKHENEREKSVPRHLRFSDSCQPKVTDLDIAVLIDEHIAWFLLMNAEMRDEQLPVDDDGRILPSLYGPHRLNAHISVLSIRKRK